MGRKKRKVEVEATTDVGSGSGGAVEGEDDEDTFGDPMKHASSTDPTTTTTITTISSLTSGISHGDKNNADDATSILPTAPTAVAVTASSSSGYSMTAHSGQIVPEDIYVSEVSSDEEDDNTIEVVVTTSRMGMMRRGLYQLQSAVLPQANRQWSRAAQDAAASASNGLLVDATTGTAGSAGAAVGSDLLETHPGEGSAAATTEGSTTAENAAVDDEAAYLARLDPAQRAARLLVEKQRREAAALVEARTRENEDNVSCDPTLFSKRTAFDIRFDQIDDKPWHRSNNDNHQNQQHQNWSEFFNYGLSEEDWLEYAEQQLAIRQELMDAYRQKRPHDPSLVPVQPRSKYADSIGLAMATPPTEAVAAAASSAATIADAMEISEENKPGNDSAAPAAATVELEEDHAVARLAAPPPPVAIPVGIGGAWGAGAAPGSLLARLMEEAENNTSNDSKMGGTTPSVVPTSTSSHRGTSNSNMPPGNQHPRPLPTTSSSGGGESASITDSHRSSDAIPKSDGDSYYGNSSGRHNYGMSDDYNAGQHHWRQQQQHQHPSYHAPNPHGDSYNTGGWASSAADEYYAPTMPPPPSMPSGSAGYYSSGPGGRGGRGGAYAGKGGGRGGYHDSGGGGGSAGGGDYYGETPNQNSWKRPLDGGNDPRRRR